MTDDEGHEAQDGGRAGAGDRASHRLDFLRDVPLRVTVELGRSRMRVDKILDLSKGSIIELDKPSSEPLDVRVNDQLVARGEVVVVNDKFGIRLTELASEPSPAERAE